VYKALLTRILICHGPGLFHKIDLKSYEELRRPTGLPSYRDHGEQIHERLAASAVIDQTDLSFIPCGDRILQVQDRIVVDILSLDAGFYLAIRRLQKSTVSTEDHVSSVSSEALKVF
jgi:hypothetical protein